MYGKTFDSEARNSGSTNKICRKSTNMNVLIEPENVVHF